MGAGMGEEQESARDSRLARLIPRGDSEWCELLSGWDDKARLEWEAEQEELFRE